MISPTQFRTITTNPLWSHHVQAVKQFDAYLKTTEKMGFRITGLSYFEGYESTVTKDLPYVHRWTPIYKKMVLAKFYQLEEFTKENPCDVYTMLTLTTYHAYDRFGRPSKTHDTTIPQSFTLLKQGWHKLRNAIRTRGYQYIWILEPHKTGYPHIHVAIFGKVKEKDQERIKYLWYKYGCGSLEHGAEFDEKSGVTGITSLRNYLMKYMVKAWRDSTWTTAQLVFNALVWKHKWRLWGSSRKITVAMQNPIERTGIEWKTTEMKRPAVVPWFDGSTRSGNMYEITWQAEGEEVRPALPNNQPIKAI